MENKKTTELIDLLNNLKDEDYEEGGKYGELLGELENREPFLQIIGKDWDTSLPAVWEEIKELLEEREEVLRFIQAYTDPKNQKLIPFEKVKKKLNLP